MRCDTGDGEVQCKKLLGELGKMTSVLRLRPAGAGGEAAGCYDVPEHPAPVGLLLFCNWEHACAQEGIAATWQRRFSAPDPLQKSVSCSTTCKDPVVFASSPSLEALSQEKESAAKTR